MASMKDTHLKHHRSMQKLHKAAAAEHEAEMENHEEGSDLHTLHKMEKDHHKASADEHGAMIDACDKATESTDLEKLVPDAIRGVVPPAPYGSALGLTAVPRNGQPPMNSERPDVPLEFEHLIKVD